MRSHYPIRLLLPLLAIVPMIESGALLNAQQESQHDLYRQERAVQVVAPRGYLDPIWQRCSTPGGDDHTIVLHLGDSHVQAGFFTMPIREYFGRQFGLSGLGLIVPYRILGTNEPRHTRLQGRRGGYATDQITRRSYAGEGPTGIEMRSIVSRPQEVTLSTSDGVRFDRVIVFHGPNDRAFSLSGDWSDSPRRPFSLLTAGFCEADTLDLKRSVTSTKLVIPAGATFYGASLECLAPGVTVHTLGHNGATYQTYLKDHFTNSVSKLKPDLIIISLGTNDAMGRVNSSAVRASVRSLVNQLRKSCPEAKIVLSTPVMCYVSHRRGRTAPNPNVKLVSRAIIEEAKALGVGYIDTFEIFGGERGADRLVSKGLLRSDRIHLTTEGYKSLGNSIADALAKDYKRYLGSRAMIN